MVQRPLADRTVIEHRFRVALAAAPIVVFNQDRELRYTWIANPALGLNEEEALGRTDEEILGMEAAQPLMAIKRRVLEFKKGERHELTVSRAGRSGWFDLMVEPLRDAAGQVVGITCAAVDITKRKMAEAALQEAEARLRLSAEAGNLGFWDWDLESNQLLFSAEGRRQIGYIEEELPSRIEELQVRVHPEDIETILRTARAVIAHPEDRHRVEFRFKHQDGHYRWFYSEADVMRGPDGKPRRMLGCNVDVTQHKRLETERAMALARVATVAELERQRIARELHDQTAQRLVALSVELKTLETNLASGRPQRRRVEFLRRAVDDLQQQVRQIAWDLRAGELAEGGLEAALRAYIEEWSERTALGAEFECRGLNGQRLPAAIESTLYRVTQEMLANVAKHARATCVSVLLERDDELVRLTVEDDGCGFDAEAIQESPETAQRLGLLGIRERVALAGGTLLIESAPGAGTTLLVRVPIGTEAPQS
ncbi:MAG: PAS domain S-box protein [Verrucomicrobiales bacterium]|nr:PAS domain S-box protein [Verrucomicrobiales bacterium]